MAKSRKFHGMKGLTGSPWNANSLGVIVVFLQASPLGHFIEPASLTENSIQMTDEVKCVCPESG